MSFPINPSQKSFSITPSDTAWLTPPYPRGIWVGGAGDVVVTAIDDDTDTTYPGAQAGEIIPVVVKKVKATGTTATNLVGMR
tara:strand:- start:135 stop:380 length:246 start_codon:yes stop_codon:yes gene_type:complete